MPYSKCIRHYARNPPVHRRCAPLYRRTKLIRRKSPKRATIRRVVPGDSHSRPTPSVLPPEGMRSGRFYNRFTNSPESPRSASSHHPAFTTVYRISHYPPLRLANSSFPGRVPRAHPWGEGYTRDAPGLFLKILEETAVIDWVRRGRL